MKLLISGFEPFGNEIINPSWEAVKRLPNSIGDCQIVKTCLPVTFFGAKQKIAEMIHGHRPDVVICVGQAGGRSAVNFERVALNIADSPKPDNEGFILTDERVVDNGPAAYFSTLPIKKMQKAVLEIGIPAEISNSAGTFVCNSVMYTVLHVAATENRNIMAGFIHLPYLPCQVIDKPKKASMSLDNVVNAMEISIAAIVFDNQFVNHSQ